jgi:hypothetical protein
VPWTNHSRSHVQSSNRTFVQCAATSSNSASLSRSRSLQTHSTSFSAPKRLNCIVPRTHTACAHTLTTLSPLSIPLPIILPLPSFLLPTSLRLLPLPSVPLLLIFRHNLQILIRIDHLTILFQFPLAPQLLLHSAQQHLVSSEDKLKVLGFDLLAAAVRCA